MKPTHKLLFVLCPMLVLGFIYYSSGKLHLNVWGQKPHNDAEEATVVLTKGTEVKRIPEVEPDHSEGPIVSSVYDKQGFLLQLDAKLPLELAYKYGNLSEGVCKPGYAAAKMTTIFPKFMKPAPMFLDRNFKRLGKVSNYLPPFGFKTQEKTIDNILTATKNYGLGEELDSLSCKRCIIVGNGGILSNKSLGSRIDDYDVVVRLNEAPVRGYVKDVGTKTTMRITYPEGAIQRPENYEKDSLFVFSAFKPLDFKWLKQMVFKEKLKNIDGFWKSVAHSVPREPTKMRILNPYFIQEAAFQFIGLPFNNGVMGKGNIPTLGTVAITMALHNCDEVAVAGFGYDMNTPHAPLHYYETVKMSAIKESWTHNISKEKEFLRKLVKANIITDLTNGI
ncbi:ST3 beta-galactoside alpha-2,3-sialyltransferase 3b isoform X1 [Lates calcarifer]|uniref:CMP-N-acetylneuraminate-beta-1,4-galactoside alpha-2,3-sialyltransferase n=1 Tax=Lates calcarifer TaxID=8187 RepID=A0A4W6FCJ1_LATCA|nr:ST3 beta-galactoside alpha-2,3-sialyltransferase 3b isoform X1 [Lates calcarifer]XP_018532624.1 ST3 beta-galactoside alpha-2,3-sialyltransferase 3b isoform X1 [Lates calcarifer]XP_018532626.1 ST3 beta-galactoside alpha-2,3-sialyltransferase 3b isoform X1 [Lates calcarifer]XP_018532627.1 ST3 beta-galactoside alpha-2,3-sialyltransferase 3b isoform X1 [Lates calcarifer]XP_050926065.1 ST3 beta-galactoside alpha-2,3-sialyltransferase 3b isoform X1 [Lates calcarifer]